MKLHLFPHKAFFKTMMISSLDMSSQFDDGELSCGLNHVLIWKGKLQTYLFSRKDAFMIVISNFEIFSQFDTI